MPPLLSQAGAVVVLLCFLLSRSATAQTPSELTAEQIMARVAANQDRAEADRAHFTYLQHAVVQSRKGKTVMCRESTESRVTPLPKGQSHNLISLVGEVRNGQRVIRYTVPPTKAASQRAHDDNEHSSKVETESGDKEMVQDGDTGNLVSVPDTDIDLVEHMRDNLTSDQNSKDGIHANLFPLTSEQQKDMVFALKGRETKNGKATFHVLFWPKDRDDFGWKGEVWVDTETFQPVVVRTALSRNMPFAVRALMGTNLPGLGFTAVYAPQDGGVWFPSSFGTEFKVRVLFIFERQIVLSVQNHDFERTHVHSVIHTDASTVVAEPSTKDEHDQP